MSAVVGIDKGTTMTKTVVFDAETGEELAVAGQRTPVFHPRPEWHEEDMEKTWAAVASTVGEALERAGDRAGRVVAVGVAGHMGGLWPLGRDGRPSGRAIGWPDARAAGLIDVWTQDGRMEKFFEISGNAAIPGMPVVLLRWLREHDPEFFERTTHVLMAKDYVNYRLTGEIHTDESDLSFVPCDIRRRRPSPELFDLLELGGLVGLLPEAMPSDAAVGCVSEEAAAATGLPPGTPVVAGMGDAVANSVGIGAIEVGQAATVIGTSFMNNVTTDQPVIEPFGIGFHFLMPDGRWQRLMANTGGGTLGLDWFTETLAEADRRAAEEAGRSLFELFEDAAASIPPLAEGVLFHPYLNTSGVIAPFVNARARGGFLGLESNTTRAQMLRAVYEGVALSMVDCYRELPFSVEEIRMTGGGARSALWCQICADAMGQTLSVPDVAESGAKGVALAAAVEAGVHASLGEACQQTIRLAHTHEPDQERHETYRRGYRLFRETREALTEAWRLRGELLEQS